MFNKIFNSIIIFCVFIGVSYAGTITFTEVLNTQNQESATFTANTTTNTIYWNVTDVDAATYDVVLTDCFLSVSYTATAAVTSITLPTAQVISGRVLIIKDTGNNAATNNITIDTEGAALIDGAATLVINGNQDAVMLICNGTNWEVF